MTVQDVIDAVSLDMRQVLSNASPDSDIIIPWVDRIQKDVLHTSLFNALLRSSQTVSVTANTSVYTLSSTTVRRITSVYDRTFDRILLPYENVAYPTVKGDQTSGSQAVMPTPMLSAETMLQWPTYFLREGASTLVLFPAPQKAAFAGTYEVYFENYAPDLAATTDTLLVPSDGKDLVVAGVNMLACQYLKNTDEAQAWTQQYEMMKKGEFKS